MVSFRRVLFGYYRPDVDAAIGARDTQIAGLEQQAAVLGEKNSTLETQGLLQARAIAEADADMSSLSGMVIEREREIRSLGERLRDANERHERSIVSLQAVSERLEEIQAQARGQATRIRMKALREAVEVSRRSQDLAEAQDGLADGAARPDSSGAEAALGQLFEGLIKLEIGPLGDFSQLVGFEDAVGQIGASDVSVERFSEGRATFSMQLNHPVELLRELESRSALEFKVRHTAPDNLILDIDEDPSPEQRAA